MLGELLNHRYRILTTLGAGGFGITYVAEDTNLPGHPRCVVKHLQPQSTAPASWQLARRLFSSEAVALQQLGTHPQIPQLLAYFEQQQQFFLVQELIEGHSLALEIAPGRQWAEADVIELVKDILEPLSFVHNHRVIHRDLKPANLIRRHSDGRIVLIDFGAVKAIAVPAVNQQGQSQATVIIGTPGYIPTEQASGRPKYASDVYALGIIAIQALTGISPEELPEDPQTHEIVWRDRARVTPGLSEILDKMVRYDFRQRYQSAGEVLSMLKTISSPPSAGRSPIASPYTPTEPLRGYSPTEPLSDLEEVQFPPPTVQEQYRWEQPHPRHPVFPILAEEAGFDDGWVGWWVAVTAAGWTVGWVGGGVVGQTLSFTVSSAVRQDLALGWLMVSVAIPVWTTSIAQWFVLQKFVRPAWWWLVANGIAGGVSGWIVMTLFERLKQHLLSPRADFSALEFVSILLLAMAAIGLVVGIAQWLVLQQLVRNAFKLAIASTAGIVVGSIVGAIVGTIAGASVRSPGVNAYWVGGVVGTIVTGIIWGGFTGKTLVGLLREPK